MIDPLKPLKSLGKIATDTVINAFQKLGFEISEKNEEYTRLVKKTEDGEKEIEIPNKEFLKPDMLWYLVVEAGLDLAIFLEML